MHERRSFTTALVGSQLLKAGVVLGLSILTLIICLLVPAPKAGGETGVLMELPQRVGPLYSYDEEVSAAERYILPPDTTFARKTYGPAGSRRPERILCSIVLSGAEKRSIHRPERCLPSQGWRISDSQVVTVPMASGHSLEVTALLLERPVSQPNGQTIMVRSYYLYWFVGKDVTTPHHYERILMTNWDLLAHRVNQRWAYVIVSAYITKDWNPNGLDAEQTLTMLKQFIHDTAPDYMKSELPRQQTAKN